MAKNFLWLMAFATFALLCKCYEIGVGIYDMTGPAAEINFMGYAVPGQRGSGIHLRLRARSFIISDGSKRVAFVSVDGGMASDLVKMRVVEKLNTELGEGIYSTVRSEKYLNRYHKIKKFALIANFLSKFLIFPPFPLIIFLK